ncbi:MAG: anti-sigma regulatory factor [Planctomycetaceae bacterium]|nr:anti-sigma regulatory factor [Planctomycetaceae bacterium]
MSHEWIVSKEEKVISDTAEARRILDELLGHLSANGWGEEHTFGIHLAVEEALMNAIKHGNQRDPDKFVYVKYRLDAKVLQIVIRDEGEGFDPDDVPDPTLEENLELPSGRGLMLMKTFMTKVEYNDKGNRVAMEKDLDAPPPEYDDDDDDEDE